ETIAPAAREAKERLHLLHREGDAIDGELVEALACADARREHHVDDLIGFLRRGVVLREAAIVPAIGLRRGPLRLALAAGIFDHDTHAAGPIFVHEIAHHPDAGLLHLDDGGDALRRAEP